MPSSRLVAALLLVACASPPMPDGGAADDGPAPVDAGRDAGPDVGPASLRDSDGDTITDGDEGAPARDTDGDGTPDYLDLDADGDSIRDADEAGDASLETPPADEDCDGLANVVDLDSDADGLPDAEEAGDDDRRTPPVDTDGDGTPDYLDVDSDGDHVVDERELELGTDPTRADSDGDGVSDLVEWALHIADVVVSSDDLTFVVPFRDPPEPAAEDVIFRTGFRRLDAYLLLDRTASVTDEVSRLRSELPALAEELTCAASGIPCRGDLGCADGEICGFEGQCIDDPVATGCIESLHLGVGTFAGGGDSYRHALTPQSDPLAARDAIGMAADPDGNEALFESAACVADPAVCFGAFCAPPSMDTVGCAGFRSDAVRVAVLLTDTDDGCAEGDGEPCDIVSSGSAAGGRLSLAGIEVVGVDASTDCDASGDLRDVGRSAGTFDAGGRAIVRCGDGADVSDAISAGVRAVLESQRLRFVDVEAQDLPGDDGDGLQFVGRLTRDESSPGCELSSSFACYTVEARDNSRVRELLDEPQVFLVELTAFADGSPVDSRTVAFIIPPDPFQPGLEEPPPRGC